MASLADAEKSLVGVDAIVSVALTVVLVLLTPGAEWSLPVRFAAFALIVLVVPTVVCLGTFALQRSTARKAQLLGVPLHDNKGVRDPAFTLDRDKDATRSLR